MKGCAVRVRHLLLAAMALLPLSAVHAIDRSQCKQYGGTQDCWMPVIGRWKYSACGEVGAFVAYDIAQCQAQGGTWGGSPPDCQGLPAQEYRRPTLEGDIAPFSKDIFANFYGPLCEGPNAGSFSWGGVFSSVNCGNANGATVNSAGY